MKSSLKSTFCAVLLLLCFAFPQELFAHAPNQSYIFLRIYKNSIGGHFEFSVTDINKALNLNLPQDMTIEEFQPYLPQVQNYVKEKVHFGTTAENYQINFTESDVLYIELGDYLNLHFELEGISSLPEALEIDHQILYDKDHTHRGFLVVEYNWRAGIHHNGEMIALVFSPGESKQVLSLDNISVWKGFVAMIKVGMTHIFIGLDHILFLLALILPSVVRRRDPGELAATDDGKKRGFLSKFYFDSKNVWVPVERFRPAFFYILKIVTLFTVAHTITLTLAATGVVHLPSRLVESIIALSIALAAWHNIKPLFKGDEYAIVFGFGLFHGFGFASVLGEFGLSGEYLTLSLLGFNLGVELGQLMLVALIFPVLFLLRKTAIYPQIIFFGSILLILISLQWAFERAFAINLPFTAIVEKVYSKVLHLIGVI